MGAAHPGSPRMIRTQLMRRQQQMGEDGENPTYIFAEPSVAYRMRMGNNRRN